MADLFENPLGTNGFAFVEYTGDADLLDKLFRDFGFTPIAQHKKRDVVLYRQGGVNFLLNKEHSGQAQAFQKIHKSGASAMGFRVKDAHYAYKEALKRGGEDAGNHGGSLGAAASAIKGIGGSLIYFIDNDDIFSEDFTPYEGVDQNPAGLALPISIT